MMKFNSNHLNHELEPHNSEIQKIPQKLHKSFKCNKCNNIIFFDINDDKFIDIKNSNNSRYWKYFDGLDYEPLRHSYLWHSLELTCEEESIKKLLE